MILSIDFDNPAQLSLFFFAFILWTIISMIAGNATNDEDPKGFKGVCTAVCIVTCLIMGFGITMCLGTLIAKNL